MPRVAILIVTYNSAAEIGLCLDHLQQASGADVLVIDNASADGTLDLVRERGVRHIANTSNLGFAAAVNQGVRDTNAELLLLLNPDAHLRTNLCALTAAFQDPVVGAAGGLLTDENGGPQVGFTVRRLPAPMALIFEVLGVNRLWPRNSVNWHYRCFDLNLAEQSDVEQPPGGFLMFSRVAYESIGRFDERFWPIWYEDVDFCARLLSAGFRIRFVPEAVAKHAGGHSIRLVPLEIREKYWYGSLLKYAAKHYRPSSFRCVCAAVAVGSVFRLLRSAKRQGLGGLAVYSAVFRHAVGRIFGPVS